VFDPLSAAVAGGVLVLLGWRKEVRVRQVAQAEYIREIHRYQRAVAEVNHRGEQAMNEIARIVGDVR
jgi:hypothetical protein